MEKRVLVQNFQKVEVDDFLSFGIFPQVSLDTIVHDLLLPDFAFSGFNVVQSGPGEVTVGNGHLFAEGKVYFNDDEGGTTIDLLDEFPAATRRIVSIVVWGQEKDAETEPRTFLIDAETRATQAQAVATERWRWANISTEAGLEGPDPAVPALGAGYIAVAHITLSTAGIESIVMATDNMAESLRIALNRLKLFDIWKTQVGAILDTMRSELLILAGRINGTARQQFVEQIAADVARLKDHDKLPSTYSSWHADHYLTETYSDTAHVDWLAKVEEGIRFPPAAGFDAQLGLLNPLDAAVKNSSNVLLPAWDAVVRLTNIGADSELSIAQYQFQNMDMVQKTMTRRVTRYGTPFTRCTNDIWWKEGAYDPWSGIFKRAGDTFQVLETQTVGNTWDTWFNPADHQLMRLQQVWEDSVTEPYWDRIITNYTVNGSVVAQTFVNAQEGWLSEIQVPFSQVALSGDVVCMITETTNGMPDVSKVIAKTTVVQADLKIAAANNMLLTRFMFQPTFLRKGRYAFILSTAGNHYVWVRNNTNAVSGTLFYSTDGAFFQGDVTKDLAFNIAYCQFRQNQTTVELNSLTLTGGIAAIDINADAYAPDGTRLFYEVRIGSTWRQLDNVDGGPGVILAGLPPLLPFRVTFVGTESVQPALGVASNSRVTTWRPRSDFRHISAIRGPIAAATTIKVDIRLEAWRGAPYHTHVCKLLHGAGYTTSRSPDAQTEEVPPDDPNALIRHYVFTGMGALTTFRLRQEGTTDNVLATFHVAEKIDIDIA